MLRSFAEGTYLNKNEVTERILNVVKHFDKIEPGKVMSSSPLISLLEPENVLLMKLELNLSH